MEQSDRGRVHLYVGDGKGKTTAAAGLALRVLGRGKGVLFVQFLKGGPSGELAPLEALGARILRAERSAEWVGRLCGAELEAKCRQYQDCLEEAFRLAAQEQVFLLVLDEVVDAVNRSFIPTELLLELLRERPAGCEAVLTGRNPPPALVAVADYHTQFQCVAHPYHQGLCAREGIEY